MAQSKRYEALTKLIGSHEANKLIQKFRCIDRILQLDNKKLEAAGASHDTILRLEGHKELRFTKLKRLVHVKDIYHNFFQLNYIDHEQLWAVYLDTSNQILFEEMISKGNKSETTINTMRIVSLACDLNASFVILIHNHPSGRLTPSGADIMMTKKLKGALELHDVRLPEHLIVGKERYYSMAEKGVI